MTLNVRKPAFSLPHCLIVNSPAAFAPNFAGTSDLAGGELADRRKRGKMRRDRGARRDALHSVHDDFLAGVQTGKYNPLAIDLLAERHFPERCLVAARDD